MLFQGAGKNSEYNHSTTRTVSGLFDGKIRFVPLAAVRGVSSGCLEVSSEITMKLWQAAV